MVKYSKYFLKFFSGFFVLLIILLLCLRLAFVQTIIAKKATQIIAKKTQTVLTIDKIAINFIDNISIKGIYAEDLKKDTLLYSKSINIDIGIWNLLQKKVDIENINIENIVARVYQKKDSTFNFQFFIDAFSSEDTTTKTSKPFEIFIGKVNIQNADLRFDMLNGKNSAKFKQLVVKSNSLNLEKLIFDLNEIKIVDAQIKTQWQESIEENTTQMSGFPLRELPISILCEHINIENSEVLFSLGNSENKTFFEASYIDAKELNFKARNTSINKNGVKIEIKKLVGNLNDHISIKQTEGNINFAENGIFVDKLKLETEKSKAAFDGKITYKSFDEILNLSPTLASQLKIKNLELTWSELIYFVPQLAEVDQFKNNKNDQIILSGLIDGNLGSFTVKDLKIKLSDTKLNFAGVVRNVLDYENLYLQNAVADLKTNVKDLEKYIGKKYIKTEYKHFGNISLDTKLDGSFNTLNISKLNLKTGATFNANLNGVVNQILNADKLNYAVKIYQVQTGISDIKVFADSLPEMLDQLSLISYQGFLKGDKNTFNLKGDLNTNLGGANTDLFLDFNEDYSNANYKGKIKIKDFDLGALLQNDSLGKTTLQANINGKGLSLDSLDVILDATVNSFEFNHYAYKDISVNGIFVKQKFDGKAAIKDENLSFDFAGLLDFNDSIPIVNFKANLEQFNAKNLNLLKFPLVAKLKIDANSKGINPKDIEGNIFVTDIYLENGKQNWKTDSITFIAEKSIGNKRKIELKSELLKVNIDGNYTLATLPQMLIAFGDEFFPFSSFIAADSLKNNNRLSNEYIDAKFLVKDIKPLAKLFEINIEKFDSASLTFKLEAPDNLADLILFIPEIKYAGIYADSIFMSAQTKNKEVLVARLKIDSINFNNIAYIPELKLSGNFFEQKAILEAIIENNKGEKSLQFTSKLEKNNGFVSAQIQEPLILNTKEWQLTKNNAYAVNSKQKSNYELEIKNGKETFAIKNSTELFNVVFQNFELANIINLVQIDSTEVHGNMNGNISLGNAESEGLSTALKIDDIRMNALSIGNLNLIGSQLKEKMEGSLSLKGNNNNLSAKAKYNIESGQADGSINISNFAMASIEPIIKKHAKHISGNLSGKIDFNGINAQQNIDGNIKFNEVKAFIIPLGTNYEINEGNIDVRKDKLTPNLVLKDLDNNKAKLNGTINHNYFSDFEFDLDFKSDKFTFLDAKYNSSSFFFGKVIASTNLQIKGNTETPKIRGAITANDGSDLTIQLISPKIAASQESYIVFVDGKDLSFEEIEKIANERYKTESSVDVDIIFNISEKTNLKLIIDPLTGDNLQLNGNARLAIKVPPYGDIDINGSYTVSSGSYRFSFQQILRKKFEIVSGSSINFTGNPLEAALNMKAAYHTDISTYGLVAEQSATLSDEEKRELKRKTEATVLLEIEGKIIEPKMKFDIVLDENNNSPVGSSVTRALARIKQNESELNKQVFSLLLFNSFSSSESSTNITSAGTSTAARSVGNLINTQLNRLANNVNGLQLNFDLDQYDNKLSENGDQITEIDVGLSQSLLDDRLTISLDGNIGLETGNASAFSSIAGNFVLAYDITKDGKYKIRAFQKSDFDALNNSNVWKTGFGFSYQAKFGKLKTIEKDEK